ncbi:hypothetical protein GGX14DRAFT_626829 [Mycena pura]|uniref:F-box domain-containing protein n=1 Tax=Mycena pura TaxID=153505 RepID=A0AAD7E461_9AGAR|nr:hypothetical protein GGX14DRAFT_626829 [Mycena pura]
MPYGGRNTHSTIYSDFYLLMRGAKKRHHGEKLIGQWEWKIPLTYSRRVRSLSVFGHWHANQLYPAPDVLEAIRSSFTEECLFPNLRLLTWHVMVQDVSLFSDIRLFLSPKVIRANLYVPATEPIISLLPSLPIQFPELLQLSITSNPDNSDETLDSLPLLSRAMSMITLKLFRIEKLSVGSLDHRALEHLSRLPNLKSLELRSFPGLPYVHNLQSLSLDVADPFCALNDLHIAGNTAMQFAIEFLNMVSAWRLQTFNVLARDIMAQSTIDQLYSTIAGRLSPSILHSVIIHDFDDEEHLEGSLADYVVNGSVLAPLCCFANLTMISLCPPAGFDIDDTTAWDLARAWPKLELLMLSPSIDFWRHRLPPIRMTLHGLRAFAEHCKHLKHLTIHVNTTEVPPLDDSTTRVSPDKCILKFFNVGASAISDPPAVAQFLCALFPYLLDVDTSVDDDGWDDELGWDELLVQEDDDPEGIALERSERSRHAKWREVAKLIDSVESSNSVTCTLRFVNNITTYN